MLQQHILLALSWIIFCMLHSILADNSLKSKVKSRFPYLYKYYRLLYTLFAIISLAAVLILQLNIYSPLVLKRTTVLLIAGIALVVFGGIIMIICIKKYFMSLSGLSTLVSEKPEYNELIITGIHRYVRHPLYLGTFIFIWGAFFLDPEGSLLIADVIITLYTLYGIRLEESKLEKEFGEAYHIYKKEVPMILPFLHSTK